jgi:hypothetical protein
MSMPVTTTKTKDSNSKEKDGKKDEKEIITYQQILKDHPLINVQVNPRKLFKIVHSMDEFVLDQDRDEWERTVVKHYSNYLQLTPERMSETWYYIENLARVIFTVKHPHFDRVMKIWCGQ